MKKNPLIVNLAPTGIVPTKRDNPNIPTTPEEIVDDITRCAGLGVSIVHLHARDEAEKPSSEPDLYARIIQRIRSNRDLQNLVLCVSTSGRDVADPGKRAAVLGLEGNLKPDMASLTLGSLNFINQASLNAPSTIRFLAKTMLKHHIKPELEVFDSGMVNFSKVLIKEGLLKPPYYYNIILGNISSAQATIKDLAMILDVLPENSFWSLGGVGRYQKEMNGLGVVSGDGVRVGLEDNLWLDDKKTVQADNYTLLEGVHAQAVSYGRSIMTPLEVRRLLAIDDR